ncbi:hypothetical protein Taro_009698 [Colocasia esculenta]|uniref:Uncharacterized protein n=1 Tax=Colocasia esculenta TaxID=4460 RepID=A0A843U1J8_COLES|nr:hypothetical protein [Colocasia esculenta]
MDTLTPVFELYVRLRERRQRGSDWELGMESLKVPGMGLQLCGLQVWCWLVSTVLWLWLVLVERQLDLSSVIARLRGGTVVMRLCGGVEVELCSMEVVCDDLKPEEARLVSETVLSSVFKRSESTSDVVLLPGRVSDLVDDHSTLVQESPNRTNQHRIALQSPFLGPLFFPSKPE